MLTSAFYFIAFITILFAVLVVTSKNPIHSVLYLVLTFFCISANYIFMLDATFVGMVNIIVYAGAIMVLFLYVLMMMNLNMVHEQKRSALFKISAAVAGGMLFVVLMAALKDTNIQLTAEAVESQRIGSIKLLGFVLFSKYQLPFEIASVLFLIAMIGAVVLGKKDMRARTTGSEQIE